MAGARASAGASGSESDLQISLSTDDGLGIPKWQFWKRRRYVVTFMAFFGFVNVYTLRVNLSVAVAEMTSEHTVEHGNATEQEFDWNSKTQGYILGSFFYGYITTQVLGGWLATRLGGNRLFGVGVGMTALLTLFTPLVARAGVGPFIALRVIEGIFEGVSYPSMQDVWSRWAPAPERSRMATVGYSGAYVGIVLGMTLSGILARRLGWPAIFYVFGAIGVFWFVLWWVLVQRGPEWDRYIDARELKYLQTHLSDRSESRNVRVPWKRILLSTPVWAIIVAHFALNWGFYTLMTELPTFMKDTLDFDIEKAGFLSALPYLVVAITMQVSGHVADTLMTRKILSTTQVRRLFCCTAFLSQSAFMMVATFVGTAAGIVTCLTAAVGMGAFAESGFFVNHLDIAPQYAGVLMGISNTAGTLAGIISPTITGYIVQNKEEAEWRIVFYIASGIYLLGTLAFGTFASGERQSWAREDSEETRINAGDPRRSYTTVPYTID